MKRRHYKLAIPAIFISLLGAFLAKNAIIAPSHAASFSAQVSKVVDGDTIELSNGERVRYIGIDTPELEKKTSAGWQKVHQPFAEEAKNLNTEMVLGKTVRLELGIQPKDKYNRTLAYCFVQKDGKEVFVQAEMLRAGFAYLYTAPPNVKYIETTVSALKEAQAQARGVWAGNLHIDSKDASQFIGERKRVLGEVKRVSATAKTIRMKMDGLNVVIFKKDLEFFEKENIDPQVFYRGKKVIVFGLIKMYQESPEIIVSNPWQIEV